MNKSTFVKFSLTLVSAAVLAACSSGSGSDDQAQIDAQKQAEMKAQEEAQKAKEAEEAAKAEEAVKNTAIFGQQVVRKNESDLGVNENGPVRNSESGPAQRMTVRLDPSLDSYVVASPEGDNTVFYYLEDFDFRKADSALETAATDGETTLKHIYLAKTGSEDTDATLADGKTGNAVAAQQEARTADYGSTKTAQMGKAEGIALVYKAGETDYTERSDKALNAQKETVAEVYGARTFALGNSATGQNGATPAANTPVVDKETNNAPLMTANSAGEFVEGAQLKFVQYGRVTSSLNDVTKDELYNGLVVGGRQTKVAAFGLYGAEGTEDHYFYRGVDRTEYNEDLAKALAEKYQPAEGKLTYQGHAVTSGIDHGYQASGSVPNALSSNDNLISGTHVKAVVDLSNKNVTGNLYDVWKIANRTTDNVLVSFAGKLANNGFISGTSTLENGSEKGAKGTLRASLFGNESDMASELGGTVASDAFTQDKSWTAAFGAKLQDTPQAPARGGNVSTTEGN